MSMPNYQQFLSRFRSRLASSRQRRHRVASTRYGLSFESLERRNLLSTTWYVDDDADPGGDGSAAAPFDTIQEGIDAASDSDIVEVAAGTYQENLSWSTKSIQLVAPDGAASTVVDADTNGDGVGDGRCLTIVNVPYTAEISNFTFTGGSAGAGGGVYVRNAPKLTIEASVITGNTSTWSGGGVYVVDASLTLRNSTVSHNTVTNGYGGGVFLRGSEALLDTNVISWNTTARDGGGVFADGGSSAALVANIVNHNTASGGGGVYIRDVSSASLGGFDALLDANTISFNQSSGGGGGVRLFNVASPFLKDNLIRGNEAYAGAGLSLINVGGEFVDNVIAENAAIIGGGMYLNNSSPLLDGNIIGAATGGGGPIDGNTASAVGWTAGGGGLMLVGGSAPRLVGNLISGNTTDALGGGIFVEDDAHPLVVARLHPGDPSAPNEISANTARHGGGMAVIRTGSATVEGNVVTGNTAQRQGGGFYIVAGATARLAGNEISGNVAEDFGGGVRTRYASATIEGNQIDGNEARLGGGLFVGQGASGPVDGNQIRENVASLYGGGLRVFQSTSTFSDNTIADNVAIDGGGISSVEASNAALIGNEIVNNEAAGLGGGVHLWHSSPEIRDNRIDHNVGDGIACFGSSPLVDGNSVSHNTTNGISMVVDFVGGGNPANAHLDVLSEPMIRSNTIADNGNWGILATDTAARNEYPLESENTLDTNGEGQVLQRWYGSVRVAHWDGAAAEGASVAVYDAYGNSAPDYGSPFISGVDGFAPASVNPSDSRTWPLITEYVVDNNGDRSVMTPQTVYGELFVAYAETDHTWNGRYQVAHLRLNTPPTAVPGGPYQVHEGDSVQLDASGAFDADQPRGDEIVAYHWDLDGDGFYDDATGPDHVFSAGLLDGPDAVSIGLRVTDILGYSGTATTRIEIQNVAPAVEAGNDVEAAEGAPVQFQGEFSDPGIPDTHTINWDFGDGTPPVTGSLTPTHVYADDGVYTVTLTVEDDDSAVGRDQLTVTVDNVAPTIDSSSVVNTSPWCGDVSEGSPIEVSVRFSDPGFDNPAGGTAEDFTESTIDWGDGNVDIWPAIDVNETPGSEGVPTLGTASGSHVYEDGGIYTVTIIVRDDEGGADAISTEVTITGVGLTDQGVLRIIGTTGDDRVTVNQQGNGWIKVHADFLPDGKFKTFDAADVERMFVILCSGDDHLTIAGSVDKPVIAEGGPGDDHLNAGNAASLLLGGSGNDHIRGGSGNDVLIGGPGWDRIVGGPGQDVLLGDRTVYDSDPDAGELIGDDTLLDILNAWNSDEEFELRQNLLSTWLNEDTIFDDGNDDRLTGSSDDDWALLSGGDTLADSKARTTKAGKKR